MLEVGELETDIKDAIKATLPDALKEGFKCTFKHETNHTKRVAENFAKNTTEVIAEPLSKLLASAIHKYVSGIQLYGTLNTVTSGGPARQFALVEVNTLPRYMGGGMLPAIPNVLNLGVK